MTQENDLAISGAEITTGVKVAAAAARLVRRPDPVTILKYRAKIKQEIRENLYADGANWGDPPEIIVVKLGKQDDYPKPDARLYGRGASDWFKAEVKGLNDRGLETYSGWERVVVSKGKARTARDDERGDARKVCVVIRIPYERIAHIDWEPDPGYQAPRFYVAYTWPRRRVAREVVLYEEPPWDPDSDRLFEVHDVKYVGAGGGPIRRGRRALERIRFNRQFRREEKWDDEA